MQQILHRLHDHNNAASLRGLEGVATRTFLRALRCILGEQWGFVKRERRPPGDPVNALLSLTFTLLHSEAEKALVIAGLDPAQGFHHDTTYSRASLACDLMEPWRPLITAWVVSLLHTRLMRKEDFGEGRPCIIKQAGRKRYYEAVHEALPEWRESIRNEARRWLMAVARNDLPTPVGAA